MSPEQPEPINNRYVITGAPGSGKTTLIQCLEGHGYTVFPEVARDLISSGFVPPIGSDNTGKGHFFKQILGKRIRFHQQIEGKEIGFYDRGLPDSLAYLEFQGKNVPAALDEAIETYRYNPVVFAAPPWKEIFCNDEVRLESFSDAEKLYGFVLRAYRSRGYTIVELPKTTVGQRISMIEKHLSTGLRNGK